MRTNPFYRRRRNPDEAQEQRIAKFVEFFRDIARDRITYETEGDGLESYKGYFYQDQLDDNIESHIAIKAREFLEEEGDDELLAKIDDDMLKRVLEDTKIYYFEVNQHKYQLGWRAIWSGNVGILQEYFDGLRHDSPSGLAEILSTLSDEDLKVAQKKLEDDEPYLFFFGGNYAQKSLTRKFFEDSFILNIGETESWRIEAKIYMPNLLKALRELIEEEGPAQVHSSIPAPESAAFDLWFGDSVVAYADGTPKVCYHGTRKGGFQEFSKGKIDKHHAGFFFSDNPAVSRTYTNSSNDPLAGAKPIPFQPPRTIVELERLLQQYVVDTVWGYNRDSEGKHFPVRARLRLTKHQSFPPHTEYEAGEELAFPWTFRLYWEYPNAKGTGVGGRSDRYYGNSATDCLNEAREAIFSSQVFVDGVVSGEDVGILQVYLRIENPLVIDARRSQWNAIRLPSGEVSSTDRLAHKAKDEGYDGLIIKNVYDSGDGSGKDPLGNIYVVFDPSQVKSVHNDGTWSREDGNLLRNPLSRKAKRPRNKRPFGGRPFGGRWGT